GNTEEEEIMRDIGAGCGEEALRVVKMMRKWVPGLMNGKPVSTHCNIPIKFSLRD
ncbi:MAG: protein TonB, partial [Saprospiraceae bacterium]